MTISNASTDILDELLSAQEEGKVVSRIGGIRQIVRDKELREQGFARK